jgi:tetratricopeptide (TPR) repeat protein
MKFLLFPVFILLITASSLSAQQVPLTTTSTTNSKLYEITYERAKIADSPSAEQAYHPKLIEASSDFYPDFNGMGYYYLENQQLDKAENAFKTYLAIAPNDAYAYYSMGDFYVASGEYDKATAYYGQAATMGMEGAQERAEEARDTLQYKVVENQKGGWE